MTGRTAIIGIGQTEFSWLSGRSEAALTVEAIRNALDDAGLTVGDVDGLVRFSEESTPSSEMVSLLRMRPLSFAADEGTGGAFAPALLGLADLALSSGRARVVVAYRAFNGRSMRRLGRPSPASMAATAENAVFKAHGTSPIGGEFSGPYGLLSPAQVFALWTRAYMDRYGIGEEQMRQALEAVVLYQRDHATRNPAALLREQALTVADYAASPIIAEPLRRADICLESDGACAIVLTTAEVAADCRQPPVYLLDTAQAIIAGYQQLFLREEILPPRVPSEFVPSRLKRLGLRHNDIHVLGLYDAASCCVLFDVESIGLCEPGQGVDWVQAPTIPYNTSGGLLAEVYLQGMNHITEVVRQLRGTSANQVPDARIGLVTSSAVISTAILSKEML